MEELDLSQYQANGAALIQSLISRGEAEIARNGIAAFLDANQETPRHAFRNAARKVGVIAEMARDRRITSIADRLLGSTGQLVQAIYFDKTPDANWKVAWHQDLAVPAYARTETPGFGPWSQKEGIHYVQPPTEALRRMVILRIHLDDCLARNGPLRILSGSHSRGRLKDEEVEAISSGKEGVACIIEAGGAVVMNPLILHASSPAEFPEHRRVVHLEYAKGDLGQGLNWFKALD